MAFQLVSSVGCFQATLSGGGSVVGEPRCQVASFELIFDRKMVVDPVREVQEGKPLARSRPKKTLKYIAFNLKLAKETPHQLTHRMSRLVLVLSGLNWSLLTPMAPTTICRARCSLHGIAGSCSEVA